MKKSIILIFFILSNFVFGIESPLIAVMHFGVKDIPKLDADLICDRIGSEISKNHKYKLLDNGIKNKFSLQMINQGIDFKDAATDEQIMQIATSLNMDNIVAINIFKNDETDLLYLTAKLFDTANKRCLKVVNFRLDKGVTAFIQNDLAKFSNELAIDTTLSNDSTATIALSANSDVNFYLDKKLIPPENYNLVKAMPGVHKITVVNDNGQIAYDKTIQLADSQKADLKLSFNSHKKILANSAIIPGMGQFISGREITGGIFALCFISSAAWFYDNYSTFSNKTDQYERLKEEFTTLKTYDEKINNTRKQNQLVNDLDKIQIKTVTAATVMLSIYTINLIDAYFNTDKINADLQIRSKKSFNILPFWGFNQNGQINSGVSISW